MSSSINQDLIPYDRKKKGFWSDYNLATLVSYAALLTSLEADRDVYDIGEIWKSNTTPARWHTQKLIEGLAEQSLIIAKPHLFSPQSKIVLLHNNNDTHLKSVF